MPLEASFELGVLLVPAVISNDATAELRCAAGEALQTASLSSILDCIPAGPGLACWADSIYALGWGAFFLFLYFSKSFFKEIYFRFHNLQIYTPTARLRGGRPLPPSCRGGCRPAGGRQAPPAG